MVGIPRWTETDLNGFLEGVKAGRQEFREAPQWLWRWSSEEGLPQEWLTALLPHVWAMACSPRESLGTTKWLTMFKTLPPVQTTSIGPEAEPPPSRILYRGAVDSCIRGLAWSQKQEHGQWSRISTESVVSLRVCLRHRFRCTHSSPLSPHRGEWEYIVNYNCLRGQWSPKLNEALTPHLTRSMKIHPSPNTVDLLGLWTRTPSALSHSAANRSSRFHPYDASSAHIERAIG